MYGLCTIYSNGRRCNRPGEFRLFDQEGKKVPGCQVCQECADEIISEYREKLGWNWTAKEER